jgi:hypothetical protein
MFRQSRTVAVSVMLVLGGFIGGAAIAPRVDAQSRSVDLSAPDAIRVTLDQQTGKRVKVKLNSGQDIEGIVNHVGAQALSLTSLTGQEFFDATIRVDQIAAVIMRVR